MGEDQGEYQPVEYWSQRLEADFNLRGTGHIAYSERYNRWLYRAKGKALRRALGGANLPARALDIGAGVGWVVDQLRAWGATVEACDVTDVAVERLRATHPDVPSFRARWGAEPIPRDDGAFDVLTLLDVAYHVVDEDQWEAGIHDAARLLAAGGVVITTDSFGRGTRQPAPHVRFRSRDAWDRVARDAGLVPVAVRPYVAWLSRDRDAPGFGWMSDGLRGLVEYGLEVVAPRPAHLRCAVFVRQR